MTIKKKKKVNIICNSERMNVSPFRLEPGKAVHSIVLEFPNGRLFLCCPLYPCLYSTRSSEPWLNSTFGLPTLPLYHAWTWRTSVYFSYNLPSFTPSFLISLWSTIMLNALHPQHPTQWLSIPDSNLCISE